MEVQKALKQNTQKADKDIKGKGINGKTIFGVICVILAAIVVIAAGIGSSWFTNGNIPTWFNYWGKGDINEPRQFVVGGEEDDNGELEFETAYIPTSLFASRGISKTAEAAYTLTASAGDGGYVPALVWESGFVNPSSAWAQGKTASDYVTVTPSGDNSATVVCNGAFGEQIKITAKAAADPSIFGTRTADYIARVENATTEFNVSLFPYGEIDCCVVSAVYGIGTVKGALTISGGCMELSDAAYSQITTSGTKAHTYYQQLLSACGQNAAITQSSVNCPWVENEYDEWFNTGAAWFFASGGVKVQTISPYANKVFAALAENTVNQIRVKLNCTYTYGNNYSETVEAYSQYKSISVSDMLDVCGLSSLTLSGGNIVF